MKRKTTHPKTTQSAIQATEAMGKVQEARKTTKFNQSEGMNRWQARKEPQSSQENR